MTPPTVLINTLVLRTAFSLWPTGSTHKRYIYNTVHNGLAACTADGYATCVYGNISLLKVHVHMYVCHELGLRIVLLLSAPMPALLVLLAQW